MILHEHLENDIVDVFSLTSDTIKETKPKNFCIEYEDLWFDGNMNLVFLRCPYCHKKEGFYKHLDVYEKNDLVCIYCKIVFKMVHWGNSTWYLESKSIEEFDPKYREKILKEIVSVY